MTTSSCAGAEPRHASSNFVSARLQTKTTTDATMTCGAAAPKKTTTTMMTVMMMVVLVVLVMMQRQHQRTTNTTTLITMPGKRLRLLARNRNLQSQSIVGQATTFVVEGLESHPCLPWPPQTLSRPCPTGNEAPGDSSNFPEPYISDSSHTLIRPVKLDFEDELVGVLRLMDKILHDPL